MIRILEPGDSLLQRAQHWRFFNLIYYALDSFARSVVFTEDPPQVEEKDPTAQGVLDQF